MTMTPKLIVFEGIDGSGKTTISRRLAASLENLTPVIWLREPGDSQWGREIRRLAAQREDLPAHEQLRLFMQDRRENVRLRILPALDSGRTVILDRYFYSTACYQGARGLDMNEILEANRHFAPEADLVILVDVDVETAMKRIHTGRTSTARLFEKSSFLRKVRRNYLDLSGKHIHRVDGNRDADGVYLDVIALIRRELPDLGRILNPNR